MYSDTLTRLPPDVHLCALFISAGAPMCSRLSMPDNMVVEETQTALRGKEQQRYTLMPGVTHCQTVQLYLI